MYEFLIRVEGGARLAVDGVTIIDSMSNTAGVRDLSILYSVGDASRPVSLQVESAHWGGNAQIGFEWYLVDGGSAGAPDDHVRIDPASPKGFQTEGGNIWNIQHFQNTALSGTPVAGDTHVADGIDYDYKLDAVAAGFDADGWSSRWTRMVDFPAGTYTFTMRVNDGGRLIVDGTTVIDQPSIGTGTGSITLTEGRHQLVFEHWNTSGEASVFLTWDPPVATMLFGDGCNAHFTAGVNGNAGVCAGNNLP